VYVPDVTRDLTFAERGVPYIGFGRGWYQAGWSADVAEGDAKPMRYFARDLVIYRGSDGVHVLDAFCGHYGAHLGHGGKVEDGSIRCPYHGWLWDSEGRNTDVPYGDGRCSKRAIGKWHTAEASGVIFIWYSSDGAPPDWDPPTLPTDADRMYFAMYPGGTHEEVVAFPGQYVIENAADLAHLKFVHRFEEIPELLECSAHDHTFKTVFEGSVPGARQHVRMRLTQEAFGVGMIRTETAGGVDSIGLTAVTPVDDRRTVFMYSRWAKCDDPSLEGQQPSGRALRYIQNNIAEGLGPNSDRPIWENMRYPFEPGPVYTADEARTLRAIRKWSEKFYDGVVKPTSRA
jgi:3-ketosteroid 9alpha-monooxygenase subunit A